jgi:hypothetical protein
MRNSAIVTIFLPNPNKHIIFLEPHSHRIQKLSLVESPKLNFPERKLEHLLPLSVIQLDHLSLVATEIMQILEEPPIPFPEHLELIRLSLDDRDESPAVSSI